MERARPAVVKRQAHYYQDRYAELPEIGVGEMGWNRDLLDAAIAVAAKKPPRRRLLVLAGTPAARHRMSLS